MKERIVVNPNIHLGKPCIANTRITVPCILELIKEGISFDEIKKEYYPDIEIDDIQACIQYAIDVIVAEDIHINAEVAI